MADTSNVIDMIFGRIDRNTDTSYRDRALQQNQNQFDSSLTLDKDRLLAEREKLVAAKEQFFKNFGLQQSQFDAGQKQQGFANNLVVNESVAKGLFRPIDGPAQQGVKPDNIFMRNPTAIPSVDAGDPTMGPGFEFNGRQLQPVNQFNQQRQQQALLHQDEDKRRNTDIADHMNMLIKMGVPPAMATIQARSPQLAAHIAGDPKNLISYFSMLGSGDPGALKIAKDVAGMMAGYQGAVADASETSSEKSYRAAMGNQANAHADLFRSQRTNDEDTNTGLIAMNKYAAEVSKLMPTTDGRYVGLIRQKIAEDTTLTPGQRAAAVKYLNNESAIRTGLPNPLDRFMPQAGINPQTPVVPIQQVQPTVQVNSSDSTSRPSGSAPAVVNTKPPTVGGPPGSNVTGPLRWTQPGNDDPQLPPDMLELLQRFRTNQR